MGSTLVRLLRDSQELKLVAATERKGSPKVGQDAGEVAGGARIGILVGDDLSQALTESTAEVVIDFTAPEASLEHARICAEKRTALVIGTTGFTPEARNQLSHWALQTPVLFSPNMSVGVNVLFKIARDLAAALGESFDVEILETHHKLKRDAPSGTALRLAEELGSRPEHEIGVQSLRGGDVVGEHTVFFFGEGERLELTHRATSRDQFARGAMKAAKWLVSRKPGVYDMRDVLGLG
jgi:4-hydroxy-tetrahydrodipicolinate reductase